MISCNDWRFPLCVSWFPIAKSSFVEFGIARHCDAMSSDAIATVLFLRSQLSSCLFARLAHLIDFFIWVRLTSIFLPTFPFFLRWNYNKPIGGTMICVDEFQFGGRRHKSVRGGGVMQRLPGTQMFSLLVPASFGDILVFPALHSDEHDGICVALGSVWQ